jgi:hypothetical protein
MLVLGRGPEMSGNARDAPHVSAAMVALRGAEKRPSAAVSSGDQQNTAGFVERMATVLGERPTAAATAMSVAPSRRKGGVSVEQAPRLSHVGSGAHLVHITPVSYGY